MWEREGGQERKMEVGEGDIKHFKATEGKKEADRVDGLNTFPFM